jgi:hypothetical protein
MSQYSTYDPGTGVIQGYLTDSEHTIDQLKNIHVNIVAGHWDRTQYRVVNNEVVAQSVDLDPDQAQAKIQARSQRDQLLIDVDRVNPLWYNTLTAEQQAELATYRQALLDVPQHTNFPLSVIWPAKPTWL